MIKTKIIIIITILTLPSRILAQDSINLKINELATEITKLNVLLKDSTTSVKSKVLYIEKKVDSLNGNYKMLKKTVEQNSIYTSFYTTNIKSLTTIYGIIITLVTFLVGFLIKKDSDSRYQNFKKEIEEKLTKQVSKIEEAEQEFQTLKSSVENDLIKIELQDLKLIKSHSKSMFVLAYERNLNLTAAMWMLIHINSVLKIRLLKEKNDDRDNDIIQLLNMTLKRLKAIDESKSSIKNDLDEFNKIISELFEVLKGNKMHKILKEIQYEFYQKLALQEKNKKDDAAI